MAGVDGTGVMTEIDAVASAVGLEVEVAKSLEAFVGVGPEDWSLSSREMDTELSG